MEADISEGFTELNIDFLPNLSSLRSALPRRPRQPDRSVHPQRLRLASIPACLASRTVFDEELHLALVFSQGCQLEVIVWVISITFIGFVDWSV